MRQTIRPAKARPLSIDGWDPLPWLIATALSTTVVCVVYLS